MRAVRITKKLLPFICAVLLVAPALAQETFQRPRIGLALSGGGAKGFAHIGVLKVLEEIGLPIDCITGTSMGSVIGGLYAIGYTTDSLAALARRKDWPQFFNDAATRRDLPMEEKLWDGRYFATFPIRQGNVQLPGGLVAGQKISALLSRLTWSVHHLTDFRELPIPFACVATDLETGEAVTLDRGFLPEAIRASIAIPTVFTPVKLNNRLLVDGGLIRNLPAEDVRRLGANIVIGVDVGAPLSSEEKLNSFFSVIDQISRFRGAEINALQRQRCNIIITPDLTGLTAASFDRADTLIKRGEIAARRLMPRLRALADSLKTLTKSRSVYKIPRLDSLLIQDFAITGLRDVSRRLVLSELDLLLPIWVTAREIEKAMARIYSSQFFERVTYRLEPQDGGTKLIIDVVEKNADAFRFGLRYDSSSKAALLLNTTFRNRAEHGSILLFDLRLGDQLQIDSQYFLHLGLGPRFGLRARGNYSRNTLDRAVFPSRGHFLFIKSEAGYKKIGGDISFLQHSADWRGFFSVHARLSLLTRLQLGSAHKSGLPLNYQFFLGGGDSFVGLRPQELMGKSLQALQLGLQYEIMPNRFVLWRWNIGNTFEQWQLRVKRRRFVTGVGLTLGAPTIIGPVELTIMGGSRHSLLANFNIGYKF